MYSWESVLLYTTWVIKITVLFNDTEAHDIYPICNSWHLAIPKGDLLLFKKAIRYLNKNPGSLVH